jgi:hypothetical protein
MKKTTTVFCALAALAAAAAFASADTTKTYMKPFDTNADGALAPAERKDGRQLRFKALDKDADGKLSMDEFVSGHMEWFNQQDTNKDGIVELAESLDFFCGPKADGTKKKAAKAHEDCVVVRTAIFKAADANGDGKLTADEQKADVEKRGKLMDKNRDDLIVLQEFYTVDFSPKAKAAGKKDKPAKEKAPAKK